MFSSILREYSSWWIWNGIDNSDLLFENAIQNFMCVHFCIERQTISYLDLRIKFLKLSQFASPETSENGLVMEMSLFTSH